MTFSPEALRNLEHIAVAYDHWRACERSLRALGPKLTWKHINGTDYLYEYGGGLASPRSQGPKSPETITRYETQVAAREALDGRLKDLSPKFAEWARLYKALRLPQIDEAAGRVLREADIQGLLGKQLMVVGTVTMPAYQLEAQTRFSDGLDATMDIDFSMVSDFSADQLSGTFPAPLTALVKAVDPTYVVNGEKSFQALNSATFAVDFLAVPGYGGSVPRSEGLRPLELESQVWLVGGLPVDQVVMDRGGRPARIVAPDPRLMALHKIWVSQQPDRNPRKVAKDRAQAETLLDACGSLMLAHPLDDAWWATVPGALKDAYAAAYPDRAPTEGHQTPDDDWGPGL